MSRRHPNNQFLFTHFIVSATYLFPFFVRWLQGTNQQQDTRFSDKEKKLLKQMKFGDCLNKKVLSMSALRLCIMAIINFRVQCIFQVDMSKVRLDVLRPWISKKITEFLHIEDDVVVEFVYNQLEEKNVSICCEAERWLDFWRFIVSSISDGAAI